MPGSVLLNVLVPLLLCWAISPGKGLSHTIAIISGRLGAARPSVAVGIE